MQENIRLLMEETGCEVGEAELALELAENDLEKAIKTIGSLLRHIYAVKGKMVFRDKNLYGLLIVVINTKTQAVLRMSAVVSYNPSVYEMPETADWYTFEKQVFSNRLDTASIPEFTQEIEQRLREYIVVNSSLLSSTDLEQLKKIFTDFFGGCGADITISLEELNLSQFRHLSEPGELPSQRAVGPSHEAGKVWLKAGVMADDSGKPASELVEGEVILSLITDDRDIAFYLGHLIGGRHGAEAVPLPAMVNKVTAHGDETEIQLYYAPGVSGVAMVSPGLKVKVIEMKTKPWWKKIMPWQ
jgi:hypothetical protein